MAAPSIRAYPDGPLLLRGPIVILDERGEPIEDLGAIVALCRCGRSQRQPLCDGLHAIAAVSGDAGTACSRRARG